MEDCIFEYEENVKGYTLKKFISGGEDVIIPKEYKGRPVTCIGSECFKENGIMIRSLRVPETVTLIKHDAFAYLVSLESLHLPETISFLGADYLIATGLEEAYIPAAVECIERPELIDRSFRVSPDNRMFSTDGFGLYEEKESKKTLIAVNASDERSSYCIAEGTRFISPRALCDIATLKRLCIPKATETVEEGSLSFTGGRAANGRGIEKIEVDPENESLLVKYDCLCERREDGSIKLLRFFGSEECSLGADVSRIGAECFKNTGLKRITFPENKLSIGEEVFSGCPLEYAYTPEGGIFFGEEDQFTVEELVLEFGKNSFIYDFGKYDEFLEDKYLTEPRVRMILYRLKNPMYMKDTVSSLLKAKIANNLEEIIRLFAIGHNCGSLKDLGDLGFISAENVDRLIELSGELEEKEMTAWLMSYKNENLSFKDELGFL